VNHVGEVFLALPLRCAKCHDHKFDPLPTRDYYSMMAFFGDTHPAELDAPFFPGEVLPDGRAEMERATREIAAINTEIDTLGRKNYDAGLAWLKEKGIDTSAVKFQGGGFFNTFNTFFAAIPEEQRPPRNIGLTPDEISRLAIISKYRSYHKRAVDRFAPVAFTATVDDPVLKAAILEATALPDAEAQAVAEAEGVAEPEPLALGDAEGEAPSVPVRVGRAVLDAEPVLEPERVRRAEAVADAATVALE
jgi:hypothetical protein